MKKTLKQDLIKTQILESERGTIYEIRESGISHSPFFLEYLLYSAIREGNVVQVKDSIERYLQEGVVIGDMSKNSISEARYWAVATISIGIHYAILGGLDETKAYDMSDRYIRYIDNLETLEECMAYLQEKAIELTQAVKESIFQNNYPVYVKDCLHYIHNHLHERLRNEDISSALGLSRDYLSHLFQKTVGMSLHQYILQEKCKEAKHMLLQEMPVDQISYTLCFSSESHFIQCFKKYYGVTPSKYHMKIQQL